MSKRRFDAAISAVELLTTEQHKELITLLVDRVASGTRNSGVAGPSPEPVRRRRVGHAPTNGDAPRRNKTDLAEALVLERPGLSSAEVGTLINQARPAADCTLRSIARRRRTIERREGRWYPVSPTGPVNPGGSTPAAN